MVSASLLIGMALVAGVDHGGTSNTATDPPPAEIARRIEEAWALPAGLSVRYKQKADRLPASARCDAYFGPPGDETEVTLQGDHVRERTLLSASPPIYLERTYDGEWFYQKRMIARDRLKGTSAIGTGPSPESILKTHKAVMEGMSYYLELLGTMPYEGRGNCTQFHRECYLRRLGGEIDPAKRDGQGRPFGLVAALKGGQYEVVGRARVGGADCLELRGPGDRLWLDPKHGYALRRRVWDWLPGTSHQFDVTLSNFRTLSSGLWLPWKVRVGRYAAPVPGKSCPDRPVVIYDLEVAEAKLGPFPEETFRLKPIQGMRVTDESLIKGKDGQEIGVMYDEGATPEETQEALDRALRDRYRFLKRQGSATEWLSAAATVVAVVYVVFRMRRPTGPRGQVA